MVDLGNEKSNVVLGIEALQLIIFVMCFIEAFSPPTAFLIPEKGELFRYAIFSTFLYFKYIIQQYRKKIELHVDQCIC